DAPVQARVRVTERFFSTRQPDAGEPAGGGTARSVIVEDHGGEISLVFDGDAGGCATLRLPLRDAAALSSCPPGAPPESPLSRRT
ncbi:MAG: hypothetical protein ACE5IK_10905, partial [Acidobacteriota bacterium]